jgi:spermidine synthase
MDRETLRSIVASFLAVYPQASALIASNSLETPVLGLIGQREARRFDAASLHQRLAHVALPERIRDMGLEDDFAVLGGFVAGAASLRKFAAGAPPNTDDRPVVAYRAPLTTYAPDSSPKDRLIALVSELFVTPEELIAADAPWLRRLAAYFAARNRYIASGRDVRPSANVEEMLAQVGAPLLDALRTSPDFRPAYDPLVRMATALGRSNVSAARALLGELTRLQPARAEASQVLKLLDGSAPAFDRPGQ